MANRYFTAVNLLLITVGVYLGVSIFYTLLTSRLTGGDAPALSGRHEGVPDAEPTAKLADYQVIVARNLFDSGRQALAGAGKGGEAALDLDKLKQTELKVKLMGTTAGEAETASAAFIEDSKTREHRMYRTGDKLEDALVKMILREKVVLTRNGKDEVLIQEEPGVVKGGGPGAAARAEAGPMPAEPIQQVTVKEEQIERAMESLGDLMSQATFRPHIEDGQPAGISISGIKPNAIFRRLRLRNGDVITGVNDQSIASVEDAMKVFGTLSTETPIQVKIKRRGREETLEYKLE